LIDGMGVFVANDETSIPASHCKSQASNANLSWQRVCMLALGSELWEWSRTQHLVIVCARKTQRTLV
jgi:hypothetical protein